MTRIAVFCDGTWNDVRTGPATNVGRLAWLVAPKGPDGVPQRAFYLSGVGTGRGLSGPARVVDRWIGGATGWGLDDTILDAYRYVAEAWEPGDEIHVFGFSRGAYTARSLVGLLRSAGIASRANMGRLREAMERYRRRDDPATRPANPLSYPWRAAFSPLAATSEDELAWRKAKGIGASAVRLRVAYVGVWDTVGALGVPGYWTAAPILNRRYQFHDTDLSSMVRSARHAVALDERRRAYAPALWTNTDVLNTESLGLTPWSDLSRICRETLPYRQEWFPGDHGGVGGGERVGLSAYARGWIAEGAEKAGLAFQPGALAAIRAERDVTEPLVMRMAGLSLAALMQASAADREGPDNPLDVAPAVFDRLRAEPGYRPRSLGRVWDAVRARMRTGEVCGTCDDAGGCEGNRLRLWDWVRRAAPPP
jgi:uncharacterized protein (DUF2235 family)